MQNVTSMNSQNQPVATASMDVPRTGGQVVLGSQIFTVSAGHYFVHHIMHLVVFLRQRLQTQPSQTIIKVSPQNRERRIERKDVEL
jgi:hypothetical protein